MKGQPAYLDLEAERNNMEKKAEKRRSAAIVRWFIISATPFVLTLWTVRVLIVWNAPSYPEFEYGRIEPDRFGFTVEERLQFAEATLDYLRARGSAGDLIYMLEDLRLPESDRSFYNVEEIGHMLDVKNVADSFNRIMQILGILSISGLIYLLARPETRIDAYRALLYGGVLTASILLGMILLILVSWEFVFVQFHELLFPPGTWTFRFSDSLIRLFPEQFWIDFGIFWTVGILIQGVFLALLGFFLSRRVKPVIQTE
jgi:integral membrane protein (TIGR01906 family)